MENLDKIIVVAIVFYVSFLTIKNFTDYLLKRKIINSGHFDNAGILDQKVAAGIAENQEANKYPSLKWGLIAFFAGIGLIFIDQISPGINNLENRQNFINGFLPFGVELVSISLGFIVYFLIVTFSKKK